MLSIIVVLNLVLMMVLILNLIEKSKRVNTENTENTNNLDTGSKCNNIFPKLYIGDIVTVREIDGNSQYYYTSYVAISEDKLVRCHLHVRVNLSEILHKVIEVKRYNEERKWYISIWNEEPLIS